MRTINKYLNIVNILLAIVILEYCFIDFIKSYKSSIILLIVFCYTMGSFNIVCSIVDFIKKHLTIGIILIATAILEITLGILFSYKLGASEIIIICIILLLLSIINLIKVSKTHKIRSNPLLIIVSVTFIVSELFIALFPIILHSINKENSSEEVQVPQYEKQINNSISSNEYEAHQSEESKNSIDSNENVLEKYEENNKIFENSQESYDYMYFKNNRLSNYSLQVVITNETETDKALVNMYTKFNDDNATYRNNEKISEFYKYKKLYYLLDFDTNNKIKLDCNNLIYEARSNENNNFERILLFSNGNIPFYDEAENGYFNISDGSRVDIASSYVICDVNDENIIVLQKDTLNTFILSTQTGETINTLDTPMYDETCIYTKIGVLDYIEE